ncbi:MAG: ATP-binding protein [Acidobacteriota bacterium]
MTASLPEEPERVEALRRYRILDTPPETAFDHVTRLAAELLRVPFSAIVFADRDRAWCKSRRGVELVEMERAGSFTAEVILGDRVLAVEDAREDGRFAEHPLVAREPGIRAYAGAPLKTVEGFRVGSLCAMDTRPRVFDQAALRVLEGLASIVMDEMELRLETRESVDYAEQQRLRPGLWAAAFNSAALGVTITGEDGWFVDVNPEYCRLTGYPREELIGHHFTLVLPAGLRDEALRAHSAFIESEKRGPSEWQIRRRDGMLVDIHLTSARFVSEDGARFRISTLTDVTAIKEFEEQLRHAEKMEAVSRLAGGAAHGFNNLLTIVTGYSQLLSASIEETDPLRIYADEIGAAADRAAALSNKLLTFSRRRFGAPERLDVNALLTAAVPAVCAGLPSNIEVATELAGGLAPVYADRAYLEQALRDLMANAREAMPKGGRITIRTSAMTVGEEPGPPAGALRSGHYIVIAVEDNGEGIDAETKKHLFEPFFTTKGVGKGTGLAMIYGMVKQFGGEVKITSAPGQGTLVSLYLPAMKV